MSEQYTETPTLNDYNRIYTKTQFTHRLLSIHWELTYRCNERCTHCYLDVMPPGAKVPGELTTEEAFRVVDELAALGGLTITFSGGELFIRDDVFEIARYARKRGFAVRFFTNGILVNEKLADEIAAVKPVVTEVSLYSHRPEVHDAITQVPGSWDLTVRAIDLLLERGVRVLMKAPLMKENVEEFNELSNFAVQKKIRFQYDTTIIPKHTGDPAPLQHRPSDDQLLGFMRERVSPESWNRPITNDDFRFCGIGLNSLAISPYGEIYTCVGARVSAGNLRQNELSSIWQDSPVWEETGGLTIGELPVCATCELREFCVRCHGTAAFEDGDMLGCSSIAYREARLRRQAYHDNENNAVSIDSGGKDDPFNGC